MSKVDDDHREFMQESEWASTIHGWERSPIKGMVVEIIKEGDRYQPQVETTEEVRWISFAPKRCANLEQAKEYAWICFRSLPKSTH